MKPINWKFVVNKTVFYSFNACFSALVTSLVIHWGALSDPGALIGLLMGTMVIGIFSAEFFKPGPVKEVKPRPPRDPNRPKFKPATFDYVLCGVPAIGTFATLIVVVNSHFEGAMGILVIVSMAAVSAWSSILILSFRASMQRRNSQESKPGPVVQS